MRKTLETQGLLLTGMNRPALKEFVDFLILEMILDGSDGGSDGDGGDGINIKQLLFCQWLGDGPDAGWDVSTARQENNGTPTDSAHTQ